MRDTPRSRQGRTTTEFDIADGILLVAKSLKVLTKMMEEMRVTVGEVGLEMHSGKRY